MEDIVKLPINTNEKFMQNKKCDYKVLAIMTLYSKFTPMNKQEKSGTYEQYRYVYKNKIIEFTDEIEKLSQKKINTIMKNMRALSNINEGELVTACKNESGEIYYTINYANGTTGNKFVTIDSDMLRALVDAFSSNSIKIYVFLKYMCKDGERKITRSYIAKSIGLTGSNDSLKTISNCTKALCGAGFINKRKVYKNDSEINCEVYYSITTHEEWKERRMQI